MAKQVGGKITPASGATRFAKGDVQANVFLIECKATTSKKSYTIKATDLAAIEEKALRKGKLPALVFELVGLRSRYAVVPMSVLEEMEYESESNGD